MPLYINEIIQQAQQLNSLETAADFVQEQLRELSNYIMQRVVNKTKFNILIVDDCDLTAGVLDTWLKLEGYETHTAKDGYEALSMLANPKPDLILLDIYMPGFDGFEVCYRIKDNKDTADIPIIFCTGCTGKFDEEKGLRMGAVDYIKKPYHREILLARVRTHIKR